MSITIGRVVEHRDRLPTLRGAFNSDLDEAREHVRQKIKAANRLVREAQAELERLQAEYQEEHSNVTRQDIRDAEDYLAQCEDYAEDVEEAGARAMLRFSAIEQRFPKVYQSADRELGRSIEYFRRFDAIAIAGANIGPSAGGPTSSAARQRTGAVDGTAGLPSLPHGMAWVSLSELDWSEVADDLEFKKAPRDEMDAMLRRFADDLLPMLRDPRGVSRDDLDKLDRIAGLAGSPRGLAFAWDCMIAGNDPIVLNAPHPLTGPAYGWTSGRHRALLARQLGWTHLPARVI